jgi:hypothetical protein
MGSQKVKVTIKIIILKAVKSCFEVLLVHLRVWEYQIRAQRIGLPREQFFEAPGSSGEQF